MNSTADDIKDYIISALNLTFGTDLFVNREPATPNNCITIFDTSAGTAQATMQRGEDYFYPSVQIRVRNENSTVAWNVIKEIQTLLHNKGNLVINETVYTVIYCSSGPALLEWDDNNRVKFIINFNIQRR